MDEDILRARDLTKDMDKNQKLLYYEQKEEKPCLYGSSESYCPRFGANAIRFISKGYLDPSHKLVSSSLAIRHMECKQYGKGI